MPPAVSPAKRKLPSHQARHKRKSRHSPFWSSRSGRVLGWLWLKQVWIMEAVALILVLSIIFNPYLLPGDVANWLLGISILYWAIFAGWSLRRHFNWLGPYAYLGLWSIALAVAFAVLGINRVIPGPLAVVVTVLGVLCNACTDVVWHYRRMRAK